MRKKRFICLLFGASLTLSGINVALSKNESATVTNAEDSLELELSSEYQSLFNDMPPVTSYGINFSSTHYNSTCSLDNESWENFIMSGCEYVDNVTCSDVYSGDWEEGMDGAIINPSIGSNINLELKPNLPSYGFVLTFLIDSSTLLEYKFLSERFFIDFCINDNVEHIKLLPDLNSIKEIEKENTTLLLGKFCYFDLNWLEGSENALFFDGISKIQLKVKGADDINVCINSIDILYVPSMMLPDEMQYVVSVDGFKKSPWIENSISLNDRLNPYFLCPYYDTDSDYYPDIMITFLNDSEPITINWNDFVDSEYSFISSYYPYSFKYSGMNIFQKYVLEGIMLDPDVYVSCSFVFEYEGEWYATNFFESSFVIDNGTQYVPQTTFEPIENILDLAAIESNEFDCADFTTSNSFLFSYQQETDQYQYGSFFDESGNLNDKITTTYCQDVKPEQITNGFFDEESLAYYPGEFASMHALYFCNDNETSLSKPFKKVVL